MPRSNQFVILPQLPLDVYREALVLRDQHTVESNSEGHALIAECPTKELAKTVMNALNGVKVLTEVLEAIVCFQCHNRIGFTGPSNQAYGDYEKCAGCRQPRAALKLVREESGAAW